jgi:ADP-ribose pyrophosphatase
MKESQNPEFLRQKYQLEKFPETDRAVKKKERRGEHVRNVPSERIQACLDRLDVIFSPPRLEGHESFDRKARNVAMMKRFMHEALIVKPGVATDEYLKHQQKQARALGHGDIDIPDGVRDQITHAVEAIAEGSDIEETLHGMENEKKQMAEEIVAKMDDQKRSLDKWIDYLATDDARVAYPDWFRYWAMRSVTGLSSFDKDAKAFPSRDEGTMNPFPELDQAVLGKVRDQVEHDRVYRERLAASREEIERAEKKHNRERQLLIGQRIAEAKAQNPAVPVDRGRIIAELDMAPFDPSAFEVQTPVDERNPEPEVRSALDAKDFARLYALEFAKLIPTSETLLRNTAGQWVKYAQGSEPAALVQSIERHKTGWCTAGEVVARSQLSRGDFYVYYSQDEAGANSIPRAAIRMEGDRIAEVRGVAPDQNLDPHIAPVVGAKMREFPDGVAYEKKAGDMRLLTLIEQKTVAGKPLTKEDLLFLYEINAPIEGFGYDKDPRVVELRKDRNPDEDMLVVFECGEEQIARSVDQINESTKAYVGKLEPGIFDRLPEGVEHVYTKFPEGRIRRQSIEIGGKDERELEALLERNGHQIYSYAKSMMEHDDFIRSLREPDLKQPDWEKWRLKSPEEAKLIRLRVEDLGFPSDATTDQIFAKAEELGLELCPSEVGPQFRLQYTNQPMNEYVYVGMKQITESDGREGVFSVVRFDDRPWLHCPWVTARAVGCGHRVRLPSSQETLVDLRLGRLISAYTSFQLPDTSYFPPPMPHSWQTLSEEEIDRNPWWIHMVRLFRTPAGREGAYHFTRHPGAASVFAQGDDGRFVMVREYRYLFDRLSVTQPMGGVEPGETPERTAARELREETGYEAATMVRLAGIATAPSFSQEVSTVFYATGIKKVGEHDDEIAEVVHLTPEEIDDAIRRGEIWDSNAVSGWCLVRLHLGLK